MDEESLLEFIAKAHKNTYAADKKTKLKHMMMTPFLPGHKCYYFKDGEWEYYDGYAGAESAPGREVVLFQGTPVWSMSYQGKTIDFLRKEFVEETFEFLKKALRSADANMPFRGPSKFTDGDFTYTFNMNGDYRYFTGKESIKYQMTEIFFQDIMGELIK